MWSVEGFHILIGAQSKDKMAFSYVLMDMVYLFLNAVLFVIQVFHYKSIILSVENFEVKNLLKKFLSKYENFWEAVKL